MQDFCSGAPADGGLVEVTLLLGSNLPFEELSSEAILDGAREALAREVGEIVGATSVRRSEAWGFSGDVFFNQVVVCRTGLSALAVLDRCESVERSFGRGPKGYDWRGARVYEDRTLDIDILYFGGLLISSDRLEVPHPKIAERPFVLELLAELGGVFYF